MSQLPIPSSVTHECYKPVVDLMRDTLVTPRVLAERWSFSDDYLTNLRRAGRGLPFVRLPLGPTRKKGGIRYRLSDIVGVELTGAFGPVTIEQVCIAIASCPGISVEARAAVQAHVRKALAER
ncbi:MAG: hypothetical protein ACKVP3_29090 [Hyphomicrobiaceae bacterium]